MEVDKITDMTVIYHGSCNQTNLVDIVGLAADEIRRW